MTFPAGFETLGNNVFAHTKLLDVYFLGLIAPEVKDEAFDMVSYGVNAYFATPGGIQANRHNYQNGNNPFAILHLRADLSDAQRSRYTDITRNYVKQPKPNDPQSYFPYYLDSDGSTMIWPGEDLYKEAFKKADAKTLWNPKAEMDPELLKQAMDDAVNYEGIVQSVSVVLVITAADYPDNPEITCVSQVF